MIKQQLANCTHCLAICIQYLAAGAIDRYLPAGLTAANLQQWWEAARWDWQMPGSCIDPCLHTMQAGPIKHCERHSKVQDRLSPGTAKWTFPLIIHSTSTNPLQAYILTVPRARYKCHCKMYEAQQAEKSFKTAMWGPQQPTKHWYSPKLKVSNRQFS